MNELRDKKERIVRKTFKSCGAPGRALDITLAEIYNQSIDDYLDIKRITLMPYGYTIWSCHVEYLDGEQITGDLYQNLMFAAQREEDEYKKELFKRAGEEILNKCCGLDDKNFMGDSDERYRIS